AFGLGTNNALFVKVWNVSSGVSDWTSLGGICISPPATFSRDETHLDAFVIGTDKAAYHTAWNGATWANFYSLGGTFISPLAVTELSPDNIHLFGVGIDGAAYHNGFARG